MKLEHEIMAELEQAIKEYNGLMSADELTLRRRDMSSDELAEILQRRMYLEGRIDALAMVLEVTATKSYRNQVRH